MKINIGGAVAHYDKFIRELPVLKLRNRDVEFTVYDGPNLCKWNGGRVNRDIHLSPEMVDKYNKFGISVSLTFSNPYINLNDKVGNNLLEMIHHYGREHGVRNKVILVNENLRKYLRTLYDFELIYSVTGHQSDTTINDNLISYYNNLESKYDYIVPKFELVFNEDFYKHINPKKYELMLNDTCIPSCPHWNEHFKAMAELNTKFEDPWFECGYDVCHKIEECWLDDFNPHVKNTDDTIGMDYTQSMIKRAVDIGYESFKLSGRENPVELISEEVRKFLRDIK